MKTVLIVFLAVFNLLGEGISQVFVSTVIDNKLLFSPENISGNTEILASKYVSEITEFKDILLQKKGSVLEAVKALKAAEVLKKQKLEKEIELINSELSAIDRL